MSKQKDIATKALAAVMGAESGVSVPTRARSSSFASVIGDLRVGDAPAVRAIAIDSTLSVADALAAIPEEAERLRNTITSAVARAKTRNEGSDYTVESAQMVTKSSVYVALIITRIA